MNIYLLRIRKHAGKGGIQTDCLLIQADSRSAAEKAAEAFKPKVMDIKTLEFRELPSTITVSEVTFDGREHSFFVTSKIEKSAKDEDENEEEE